MLNFLCLLALINHDRDGSRGRVQGVHTPLPPTWDDLRFSNTNGILRKKKKQKKTMWFIGVEEEQETSAPPPKTNPGSAPARIRAKR